MARHAYITPFATRAARSDFVTTAHVAPRVQCAWTLEGACKIGVLPTAAMDGFTAVPARSTRIGPLTSSAAPRFLRPHRSRRALFLPALRTPHALRHILEPSIPAAQSTEGFRLGRPFMAAGRAFEDQCVLTELIAKFLNMKSARHAANCCGTSQTRPSSVDRTVILYSGLSDATHVVTGRPERIAIGRGVKRRTRFPQPPWTALRRPGQ